MMNTLYDILGIESHATPDQIETAYRRHLGKIGENEQSLLSDADKIQMQVLKEAYSVLSSNARRKAYDAKLSADQQRVHSETVEARPISRAQIVFLIAVFV